MPPERYRPPSFVNAFGRRGGGSGRDAMALPSGLATGPDGLVWVADTGNDRVLAWTPDGRPHRVVGVGRLAAPMDVAVAGDGSVFVADTGNDRVVEFDAAGTFVRQFGAGDLTTPRGVAVDSSGHVLASDPVAWRVRAYDVSDGSLAQTYTKKMSAPQGLAVDASGDLWVAQNSGFDAWESPVVRYASEGSPMRSLGGAASNTFGGLSNPAYVCLDGAGHVLVTASDYGWVSVFRTDGAFAGTFGAAREPLLRFPSGIVVAGTQIYVADAWSNQIQHYEASA